MRKKLFALRHRFFVFIQLNSKTLKGISIVALLFLLCVYLYLVQPIISENTVLSPLADIFSIALGFLLASSLQFIRIRFKKSFEDELKTKHEYSSLEKQYGEKYDYVLDNNIKKTFKYAPRFVNVKGGVHIDNIIIQDELTCFEPPTFVQNNLSKLLKSHSASKIANGMLLRLNEVSYKQESKEIHLETMRTRNYFSLAMNRASDYDLSGITLREMYESFSELTPLKQSVFSNHIGVQVLLRSADGYISLVARKEDSTVSKNGLCSSFASKFDCSDRMFRDLRKNSSLVTGQLLIQWTLGKLNEKFSVDSYSFEKECLHFLGVGQELYECGRPQIFFYYQLPDQAKECSLSLMINNEVNNGYNAESDIFFVKDNKIEFEKETRITSLKDSYKNGVQKKSREFKMIEDACLANIWHMEYYKNYKRVKCM